MSDSQSEPLSKSEQNANAAIESARQIRREKNLAEARAGKISSPKRESAREYSEAIRKIEAIPPVTGAEWLRRQAEKRARRGGT